MIPTATSWVAEQADSIGASQAVEISVVITFIVTLLIVLFVQVGVTYLIKHVKTAHKTMDVPTEAPPQQQQPTPGPLYEEVAPAEEAENKGVMHMDQLDYRYFSAP